MALAFFLSGLMVVLLSLQKLKLWLRDGERGREQRMGALVDELVAAAEEVASTVAEKTEALQVLLHEADRRAARLEADLRVVPLDSHPGVAKPEVVIDAVVQVSRAPVDRNLPIYALADDGLDADAIARRTGRPLAEIQLVLGLRATH